MKHRHIFRMTYYENIRQFLESGAEFSKNHTSNQNCYRISYEDIVSRRGTSEFQTPCKGVVNDFVPFYFSPFTGMAFSIHGGRVPLRGPDGVELGSASMEDVVFLVCDIEKIHNLGLAFWFTDIACNSQAQLPKYENELSKVDSHIAWSLFDDYPMGAQIPEIGYLGACSWFHDRDRPPEHRNRSSKRMAEFMVKDALPMDAVECIIVKSEGIKQQIEAWVSVSGYSIPVHTKSGCYF